MNYLSSLHLWKQSSPVDLVDKVIKEDSKFVQMYEISIEHKSGKQAQEK